MEKGHLPRGVTSFRFGEMKKVLLEKGGKVLFHGCISASRNIRRRKRQQSTF